MKANKDMMMREIAGEYILIPVGAAALEFQGIMTLNESGLFLWRMLQEECTEEKLVLALTEEYEVDIPTAQADVKKFLFQLQQNNALLK
ncbi:MAG: PqqD family protein [Schaedlerella sp.]|nr:PqqD family protein [Lachnospiraceae bacterium]MDY4203128.1 PqqD family protein [Schaedlerella sp.]